MSDGFQKKFNHNVYIIIIMYIYHVLINALSGYMIHVNLNTIFYTIFYTHVEHSSTKTIYIKYYVENTHTHTHARARARAPTHAHTHTHTHTHTHAELRKYYYYRKHVGCLLCCKRH